MPIQPNAKTFSVRNIPLAKQSTTCTATQQNLFVTYFTDLSAAIFTNTQSVLETTPEILQTTTTTTAPIIATAI